MSNIIAFPTKTATKNKAVFSEVDRRVYLEQLTHTFGTVIAEFLKLNRQHMVEFEFTMEDIATIFGISMGSQVNAFIASSVLQKDSCSDKDLSVIEAASKDTADIFWTRYQAATEAFLKELKDG